MVNFPRRLWVSTSNVHRSSGRGRGKKMMPYPTEILVETDVADVVEDVDDKAPRRPGEKGNNGKEGAEYWKGKALALEGALEKLEEKVTALEQESEVRRGRGPGRGGPPRTRRSPDPPVPAIPRHDSAAPPPVSSPGKMEGGKAATQKKDRRDNIVKQLVSEMERLIEFHASKIADEEERGANKGGNSYEKGSDEEANAVKDSDKEADIEFHAPKIADEEEGGATKGGDSDEKGSDKEGAAVKDSDEEADAAKDPDKDAEAVKDPDKEGAASKDPDKEGGGKDIDKEALETVDENDSSDDTLPSRRQIKIDTATLEDLVTKILATDSSRPHRSRSDKLKSHRKKKPQPVLYQLSCKKCIGQNFLGSTKHDLKDKVKENYGIVWQHVCTAYGRGGGEGPEEKDAKELEQNLSFRASSFAHHVATHCRKCESQEEVYNWCLENVKVERVSKQPMLRCE